jgi:hypothetical protein
VLSKIAVDGVPTPILPISSDLPLASISTIGVAVPIPIEDAAEINTFAKVETPVVTFKLILERTLFVSPPRTVLFAPDPRVIVPLVSNFHQHKNFQ